VLVDLFAALAKPDGAPDPQFFNADLLHLSAKGYERWGELLNEALTKVDVAPGPAAGEHPGRAFLMIPRIGHASGTGPSSFDHGTSLTLSFSAANRFI
jgi:hypothetical protein